MKKLKLLLFFLFVTSLACEKDEEEKLGKETVKVITNHGIDSIKFKKIKNIPELQKKSFADRVLLLVSNSPGETMGDLSLASKVIKNISKYVDDVKFVWVIKQDQDSDKAVNFLPDNTAAIVIKDWGMLKSTHLTKITKEYDGAILFALEQAKNLRALNKNGVQFTEYDYLDREYLFANQLGLVPGFCENCAGIYLNSTQEKSDSEVVKSFEDKLSQYGRDTYDFYMAYFNKWINQQSQEMNTSLEHFAQLVVLRELLEYEDQGKGKTVDIVLPGNTEQFSKVEEFFNSDETLRNDHRLNNKISSLSFEFVDSLEKVKQSVKEGPGLHIRWINLFPLKPDEMRSLTKISNSFVGSTGDQSLSEALSEEKVIYYQCMSWKYDLYKNLVQFIDDSIGDSALLNLFKSYENNDFGTSDLISQAEFVADHIDQLERDAKELTQAVRSKKNMELGIEEKVRELLSRSPKSNHILKDRVRHYTPSIKEGQKIPKVFHHVWHAWKPGSKPSQQYQQWMGQLKELHPDWEFKLWDIDESLKFVETHYPHLLEVYKGYDKPIKRVDSIRYLVLHHFGGVYLDMGFVPMKNIEPLLDGADFVAAEENPTDHVVNMAFIGTEPGHPLIDFVLSKLDSAKHLYVLDATGPMFFSRSIHEYLNTQADDSVRILPRKFIYPYGWWNEEKFLPEATQCLQENECSAFPDAFLVKSWGASWGSQYKK